MPCKRIVNGKVVYWPERCDVGKKEILLDPKLTPMENVWRMVRIASLIRLAMYRLWAYDYQDMSDLEIMVQMATYNKLLRMVRDKEYNRNFSFYVNVRGACWSVCQHVVDAWMQDIRQRYKNLDGDGSIVNSENGTLTLFDSLAAHKVPRLMTESDYYSNYLNKRRWFEYDRPSDRTKALRAESYASYDEYCEDCLLFNVSDVLSYDDFVKQNYTPEERKIIAKPIYGVKANKAHDAAGRPRLAPDKYKAKLAYQREWYKKNKGRPRKPKKSIAELEPEQREERRSYYRDWYKRNREKLLAYNAEYRAANRDRIRQYSKDWYAKKKEKAAD